MNDTSKHVEGADDCKIYKVRLTHELIEKFASRTEEGFRVHWDWGEPDREGFYTPSLTIDRKDIIKGLTNDS